MTAHEAAEPVLVSNPGHGAQESDPPLCPRFYAQAPHPDLAVLGHHSGAPPPPPQAGRCGGAGTRNLLGGHPTSGDSAASCETDWLLAFAANNKKNNLTSRQRVHVPRRPSTPGGRAWPGPRMRVALSHQPGLQLPPCHARTAPPPAAPRASRKWSPGRGASPTFAQRRRRDPGARCGRVTPEMASAGGGDCEGAGPEADRPHQRPFLIGVSGGTASGKVRGWRRGGACESPWAPPELRAACRASVQREAPAASCREVSPARLPGVDRAGAEGLRPRRVRRGAGRWTPRLPASSRPAWPLVVRVRAIPADAAQRPPLQAQPLTWRPRGS